MSNTQEKAQHTPGPWGRNIPQASIYSIIYAANNGRNDPVAAILINGLTAQEIEANADLIAAAPELLVELQYAHAIIKTLLNLVPFDRKAEMATALAKVHDGEGAVRYHERAAVITKAGGGAA